MRPYTWLHPNASPIGQIPLAPRAPSIHGPNQLSIPNDYKGELEDRYFSPNTKECVTNNGRHAQVARAKRFSNLPIAFATLTNGTSGRFTSR